MTEPLTPERLAEIRDRHRPHRLCDDCTYGRPCHARDLLAEVDRLTAPPTHEERQHGLSDGHSESYRRGWRMGRALATDAQAEVQRLGTEADALAQRAREAEAEVDRLRAQVAAVEALASDGEVQERIKQPSQVVYERQFLPGDEVQADG